jgi:L-ribulose-5-phosphate 3-epimerase
MDFKRAMKNKIGFMQGRLVKSEKKGAIQYFPSKNWKKELELANKNRIKLIEWTVNIQNIKSNPLYTGKIYEVINELKKNKIATRSVTCDFFMEKPFFKKKYSKNKDKYLKILKKIILNGSKVGIKYFVLPLVDNSSLSNKFEELVLIKEIKKICKTLKKNKYIIFETDYKPHQISNFINKFKSKKVGINYDTGNSSALGYKIEDEIKYFKYVKNIHIKDRFLNGHTVRLGKGNWKYKKFFNKIKNTYKGNFILQTAPSNNNPLKELLLNKIFLNKLLH